MRAREFILESVSAGKVLDYVNSIHPASQKSSNLDQIILANTEYVLKTVPVSSLQINADTDPYGRVIHVDVDYADDITPEDISRKPIVIDLQGHILDGNHRAWQARESGMDTISAYVPVKELTESLDPEVAEFLNDLTPDDVGVDEVGDYRVHFEGFTDDCQSSRAYCQNPEAVFQEVFADFVRREGGQQPVASGIVGDEDYPILYSVFKNTELTEGDGGTAISLSRLGKFYSGTDTLAEFVPERAQARYALHPEKWESTFFSLTNKDPKKINYYSPKKIAIPPGTLVGDMAIANKFYRAKTAEEQQHYADLYKQSLQPYPVDISQYRMPELLIINGKEEV